MRFIFGIVPALLLALFVSIGASGCASAKKKANAKPKPEVAQSEVIGVIEMVNPEQNYVLVRCDRLAAFSAGTELFSVDALGAESKLVVTPEKKGYYLTADIKSGSPVVANAVVRRHTVAPALTPTPASTPVVPAISATPAMKPADATAPALSEILKTPSPAVEPASPQGEQGNGDSAPAMPTLEPVVR